MVGPERTYAVQSYPSRNFKSPLFTLGEKGYLLFADENSNEPILADYTRDVPKGIGFTRAEPPVWFKWVPVRIRGMVLAEYTLQSPPVFDGLIAANRQLYLSLENGTILCMGSDR